VTDKILYGNAAIALIAAIHEYLIQFSDLGTFPGLA
jgi:hypothetical protein